MDNCYVLQTMESGAVEAEWPDKEADLRPTELHNVSHSH